MKQTATLKHWFVAYQANIIKLGFSGNLFLAFNWWFMFSLGFMKCWVFPPGSSFLPKVEFVKQIKQIYRNVKLENFIRIFF